MKVLSCGILLSLLILSGCANPQQQQRVDQDLAEMKRRLAASETALVSLRKELANGGQQQLAGVTRNQADLKADFDSFRNQVLSMRGGVEEQTAAQQKVQTELNALRDELHFKVKALEERLAKLEAAPVKAAASVPAKSLGAEELYRQGLDAIRNRNDFAAGRERLQAFLKQYPKHHLAVNATYWIGEAWYGEKKYENAILQFQDVVEKYGEQPKVASALLKQGLAFQALGDRDNARVIWAKLQERFPKSPEAKKATGLMKK